MFLPIHPEPVPGHVSVSDHEDPVPGAVNLCEKGMSVARTYAPSTFASFVSSFWFLSVVLCMWCAVQVAIVTLNLRVWFTDFCHSISVSIGAIIPSVFGRWLGEYLLVPLFPSLYSNTQFSLEDGILPTDCGQGCGPEMLAGLALGPGALSLLGVVTARVACWFAGPVFARWAPTILSWFS